MSANKGISSHNNGQVKSWMLYFPSLILLLGLITIILVILQPFKSLGSYLSITEKEYFTLAAGVFILTGLFLKTSLGVRIYSKLLDANHEQADSVQSRKFFRLLNWLILPIAFLMILIIYFDEKQAVADLDFARGFNDTYSYVFTSSYPLSDIHFWAGMRSFTLPLFYKLIGYTSSNYFDQIAMNQVGRVQILFSELSWVILALSISLAIKDKFTKVIGFAIILLLGASLDITIWDKSMLSESISTSLLVVFLATIIIAGIVWDKKHYIPVWEQSLLVGAILIVGILYSFARDPNAYFVLFISGLMLFGIIFPPIRKHSLFCSYLAVMIGLLTIFFVQNISVNVSKRFESPLIVNVMERIVPSQENLNYFIQHGMPFNDKLASMSLEEFHSLGYHGIIESPPIDPAILPFVEWIDKHGKLVTLQFLLSRPVFLFITPLKDFWYIVNGDYSQYSWAVYSPTARPALLTALFFPRTNWWPYLSAILLLINVIAIWKSANQKSIWYLSVTLFLSTYPMAVLVWQTVPIELGRHALQIALLLRLVSWVVIVLILEKCINFLKKHRVA